MYEVETKDGLLSFPPSKNDKHYVLCACVFMNCCDVNMALKDIFKIDIFKWEDTLRCTKIKLIFVKVP